VAGKVTMSADLDLTYEPSNSEANTVVDLSGEYCFGQNWGCENATTDDNRGFGVPITMPAGQLVELFGDISDSTFDGTDNFGPLPTGKSWGAVNDFYLLPGGCGQFGTTSTARASRSHCRLPLSTVGFRTTRSTWRACLWNMRFRRTKPVGQSFRKG